MGKEIEVAIKHPMEEVLDIEEGSTVITRVEHDRQELAVVESYDEKDTEIEGQFQEVYVLALDAFETQVQEAELVEAKYKARNQEVAAQFLNTALGAAKEKSTHKQHKDRMMVDTRKAITPKTLNQNVIVADRNEILKTLMQKDDESED